MFKKIGMVDFLGVPMNPNHVKTAQTLCKILHYTALGHENTMSEIICLRNFDK